MRASGEDAEAAVAAIVDLVKRDFDEAGDHGRRVNIGDTAPLTASSPFHPAHRCGTVPNAQCGNIVMRQRR